MLDEQLVELVDVIVLQKHLSVAHEPALDLGRFEDLFADLGRRLLLRRDAVGKELVALDKVRKLGADRVALATDARRLQHARVTELHHDKVVLKVVWGLACVRLDAADKVGAARAHLLDKKMQAERELAAHGRGTLVCRVCGRRGLRNQG
jgi:hypothetical protein